MKITIQKTWLSKSRKVGITLIGLLGAMMASAQTIRYVKPGGTGNGSSWLSASGNFQTMINDSASGDQVWVAAGTYQPATVQSFTMKEGVGIYGGFIGNETIFSQRQWYTNQSILKGNGISVIRNHYNGLTHAAILDGFVIRDGTANHGSTLNGGGIYNYGVSPKIENCVFLQNTSSYGGGIYNGSSSSPTLINCIFYRNNGQYGGAMVNSSSSNPTIINCTFSKNQASFYGRAIYNATYSTPVIINSIIYGNTSNDPTTTEIETANQGGGATLINSILGVDPLFVNIENHLGTDNIFGTADDGLRLMPNSPAIQLGNNEHVPQGTVKDIAGNPRIQIGSVDAGAYESSLCVSETELYVDANVVSSGRGTTWSTAYKTLKEALDIATICSNIQKIHIARGTYYPTGTQNGTDRNATFLIPKRGGVEIYGGYPNGGGTRNIKANPTILSGDIGNPNDIADNSYHVMVGTMALPGAETVIIDGVTITAGNANGGQYTYNGEVTNQNEGGGLVLRYNINLGEKIIIRNTTITKNRSNSAGGGLYLAASSVLLHNTVISENTSLEGGGGVFIYETANPRFVNSLIVKNTALKGAGILSTAPTTSLKILNCTLADNVASSNGHNLHNNGQATATITNSIIWSNDAAKNIYHTTAPLNITYSNVLQATGIYEGIGNINEIPLFQNITSNDYSLLSCSVGVNLGNNTVLNDAPTGSGILDVVGNTRIYENNVDMGAYELQIASGIVNFTVPTLPAPALETGCLGSVFPERQLNLSKPGGQMCFSINENTTQVISAPQGAVFSGVIFASYGNASGNCTAGFTMGACNAANSKSLIEGLALGNNSFSINSNVFADPCLGTVKKINLTLAYSFPQYQYSWVNDNPAIGLAASGTGNIPSFTVLQNGTANITVTAKLDDCTISHPVTFSYTIEDRILYVDGNIASSGNGKTWATAFKTLKEAMDLATQCKSVKTINVAKGTYYPTGIQSGTNRNTTFLIPQSGGIEIYGGYPNGGGVRNSNTNPTILSGDIGTINTSTDNSYHVLTIANTLPLAEKVIIDGFTITGGNANGAFTYNYNNVDVFQNKGGGLLFDSNGNLGDKLIISNCLVTKNSATTNGGGGFNLKETTALIYNTKVIENNANLGGGFYIANTSSVKIVNALIADNSATNGGGVYNLSTGSSLTLMNSTIVNNVASSIGDNINLATGTVSTITNSIVWGYNAAKSIYNSGILNISYSDIFQPSGVYAGQGNLNVNPLFKDVSLKDYSLTNCSLVTNSGNNNDWNNLPPVLGTSDIAGNPRIFATAVDMGAYELQTNTSGNFTIPIPAPQVACLGKDFEKVVFPDQDEGELCFILNADTLHTVTAPAGMFFSEVVFASYGTATGTCETGFTLGTCNSVNSKSVVESLALNNNTFTITPTNTLFGGDPCYGIIKKLFIRLKYAKAYTTYTWTNSNPAIGLPVSGTGDIPSFTALQGGVGTITVTAVSGRCTTSSPVTFTYTVESDMPIYVDGNVNISGNGKSWATAVKTLNEAITMANNCKSIKIINVAKGTYYPTGTQVGTDRNATFLIPQRGGIEIYGGFPNGGGIRNEKANPTILSGDIGTQNVASDNSYHVLTMVNTSPSAGKVIIDGFTITGGNANGVGNFTYNGVTVAQTSGAGIRFQANGNLGDNLIIGNTIVTGNSASNFGGGIYLHQTSVLMNNTQISGNNGANGGGIYVSGSPSVKIINSIINDNTATNGGGVHNTNSNTLLMLNNTIANNTASTSGHNLYNFSNSIVTITNCVLWSANASKNIYNAGTFNSTYSNIQQSSGVYPGLGNINADPLFKDLMNKDYTVMPCSSIINAGSNEALSNFPSSSITFDILGNPRISQSNVDMGAYERQTAGGVANFTISSVTSKTQCKDVEFSETTFPSGINGQVCYVINENTAQTISAPIGAFFTKVIFASYGNASGDCSVGFTLGTCNSPNSRSIVESRALLKNSFSITPSNSLFGGDPCSGTLKKLYVTIAYAYPEYSWTNDNPGIGLPASGTGNIPAFTPVFAGVANITVKGSLDACTISNTVTSKFTALNYDSIYVDQSVAVSGNGRSWATAFKTFQEALAAYPNQACKLPNIFVAKGTYTSNYATSFTMPAGVKILGGYPNGGGERNIAANATILRGNSSTVIRNLSSSITSSAVLDGFIITAGNSTRGGGIYNLFSSPTLSNLIIKDNAALYGAGIYNSDSSPIITNVVVINNNAGDTGAAMYNDNSNPILTNVTITSNTASLGAGIYNKNSNPQIRNSIIFGNSSGLTNITSVPVFESSLIQGQTSTLNGNINGSTNPLFKDAAAGNYQPLPCSPVVNAGSNAGIDSNMVDILGNPRLYETNVDMGAYESQVPAGTTNFTITAPPSRNICIGTVFSGTTFSNQYPQSSYSWTNDNPAIGLPASGTGNVPSFTVAQTGTANITLTVTLDACTISHPVTFKYVANGNIAYVDGNVTVSGNGTSWAEAFKTLNEAIAVANECQGVQTIHVAKGIYYPTGTQEGTDRNATFLIPQRGEIEFYGGYPNGGGTRDVVANPTILSGEIGNQNTISDNSYHVMAMINTLSQAQKVTIDGFTITGGNANSNGQYSYNGISVYQNWGGGFVSIENEQGSIQDRLTINNCIIKKNNASRLGGGLHLSYSGVQINNTQISENLGDNAGGIHLSNCQINIDNSVINNNTGVLGGGIRNGGGSLTISNSTIAHNTATSGGGIEFYGSKFIAINVAFIGNNGTGMGGGIAIFQNQSAILTNVTMVGNSSPYGGGIMGYGSSHIIRNSIIYGNDYNNNGGIYLENGASTLFSNSLVQGFTDTANGNINGSTNPLFVNPANGDYRLQDTSPVIDKGNSIHFATGQTPDLSALTQDLDGNKRWIGLNVDMGAYENQSSLGSCPDDTVWNGTTWSNGAPDTNKKAYVNGDLTLVANLEACELEVTTDGSLNIPTGKSFTVNDKVVNKATVEDFTIESGGSLLQVNDVQNTGAITVNRNSFPLYRQDYTLWGSPVAQHNLRSFSPQTLFNRFYSYDTDLGTEGEYVQEILTAADVQNKLFEPAKGYMVRMPNDWPVYVNNTIAGTPYPGKFVGVPNNGDIAISLSTGNTGMNLVANPYPSPLSISDLFNANPGIEQTIYFWRKRNGVAGSGYASYNAFGLASPQPEIDGLDLDNSIAVGQGFFVQSTGATTLQFGNPIRKVSPAGMMLRSGAERHRIWLNLSNSTDIISQTLLGYATGATEGADNGLDGAYFNDSPIALTSLIGGTEYAIQARPVPFDINDEVPLGFKATAGTYTISLSNTDGLFLEGQDIYLKDSQLGQVHDLKTAPYNFATTEGTFNNRFSVVYQSALGNQNPELDSNNIVVYKKGHGFHINAGKVVMQKIELFDIRGRLIYTLDDIGETTAKIENLNIANQVLLMKITSVENQTVVKKVIY